MWFVIGGFIVGKNPSFPFYVMDWARDLDEHPLEIEGAWIRIVCRLWWSETRGELTRSREQWATTLRTSIKASNNIISYIKKENIGTIVESENGFVTIRNRRMYDLYIDNEKTRLRVQEHRARKQQKQDRNGIETSCTEKEKEKEDEKEDGRIISDRFEMFWKEYPKRVGKKYARLVFLKLKPTGLLLQKMLMTLQAYKQTEQWQDIKYIPHPSTWLNQERWEDDLSIVTGGKHAGILEWLRKSEVQDDQQ